MNLKKCSESNRSDENERTQRVLFFTVESDRNIRNRQEYDVCHCNTIGLKDKEVDKHQNGTNNDCVHIN